MRKEIAFALAVTSVLLAACATGPRPATGATVVETRSSCETTIYRTADYDEQTALRCARLLDIWD